jgi:hypothetical protein
MVHHDDRAKALDRLARRARTLATLSAAPQPAAG